MKMVKKKIQKNIYFILAFLVPFVAMLAANIAMKVFPFGDKAILVIDSYHQYAPFFSEFYDKILHGGSLFYTWNGGLGVNFWAIVAYYLSSPLNLLVLLFPRAMLTEAFALIIMLKVGLSGLSFSYYIHKHYKKNDVTIVFFSSFYALSGWVLGYNWNIMWLDCIILFPLIILGLERLMKDGKGLLYCISLGLCIFCNYYISIMICMFLVIYFLVLFIQKRTRGVRLFFKRAGAFAGYSLLSGGMAMVMVLPAMFALLKTHSAESTFPDTIRFTGNFFDILGQHFAFVKPTDLSGLPNLYCGAFALMFIVLYLFRKKTPLRYKISRILLLVFLILSCNVNVLDYIWHGFHYPNSLPNRFTFIYIFLVLAICYEVFLSLKKYSVWQIFVAFMASMLFVVISHLYGTEDRELYTYIATMAFLWVYFIVIVLYRYNYGSPRVYKFVLAALLSAEAVANGIYGLMENGTVSRTTYNMDLNAAAQVREIVGDDGADGLYRTELNEFNGRNNSMWLGFKSLSLFTSTLSDGLDELIDHMGFYATINKFSYECSTRLTDDIFAIRYLMSEKQKDVIRGFNYLQQVDNNYLYENPDALSVAYMVDEDYAQWETQSDYPWIVLNDFARRAAGVDGDVFEEEWITGEPQAVGGTLEKQENHRYHFVSDGSGDDHQVTCRIDTTYDRDRYIFYEADHMERLMVEINGDTRYYYDTRGHIVDLGQCGPSDEILLTWTLKDDYSSADMTLAMFGTDEEVYAQVLEKLSRSQMTVTSYTDTSVTGEIDADESGILFMSIPYDAGWSVYVDGQSTEVKSLRDSLMYIDLSEGHHEIEMKFMPKGFIPGLCLSLLSVGIVCVLCFFGRKKPKVRNQ